jgi:7-keto-8-aminopelargonate synthetase-like enzyme
VLGHATRIRDALRALGRPVPAGHAAIVPVHVGSAQAVIHASAALFERGLFVHGIRPPTVPPDTCRLRITPMATHQPAHVERLIDALHAAFQEHA